MMVADPARPAQVVTRGVTPARPTQVVTQVLPTQVEVSLGRLQRRLKRPHLKVKMFACRHSVLRGPLMGCQNT